MQRDMQTKTLIFSLVWDIDNEVLEADGFSIVPISKDKFNLFNIYSDDNVIIIKLESSYNMKLYTQTTGEILESLPPTSDSKELNPKGSNNENLWFIPYHNLKHPNIYQKRVIYAIVHKILVDINTSTIYRFLNKKIKGIKLGTNIYNHDIETYKYGHDTFISRILALYVLYYSLISKKEDNIKINLEDPINELLNIRQLLLNLF